MKQKLKDYLSMMFLAILIIILIINIAWTITYPKQTTLPLEANRLYAIIHCDSKFIMYIGTLSDCDKWCKNKKDKYVIYPYNLNEQKPITKLIDN